MAGDEGEQPQHDFGIARAHRLLKINAPIDHGEFVVGDTGAPTLE